MTLNWEIKIIGSKNIESISMKKNKTIAVLRGGLSLENEVSNSSANFVIKALKSIGYNTLI